MNAQVSRRKSLLMLGISLPLLVLQGCAVVGGADAESAAVLERANAYWSAIKANDHVSAWSYEDVSKDPNWTLQSYLQRGGLVYEKTNVLAVSRLDGDGATVDVAIQYSVPIARLKNQQSQIKDSWKKLDGQWYHVLSRGAMFEKP